MSRNSAPIGETRTTTATTPAWLDWIRPWYFGGEDVQAGRFNQPPVYTCQPCLHRHNGDDDGNTP